MLTAKDLCEILQIHTNTLTKWMKKGVPHYKVGNVLRYDLDEVKAWMKNNTQGEGD